MGEEFIQSIKTKEDVGLSELPSVCTTATINFLNCV